MSKDIEQKMPQKGVFTGIIEKDENNNYFCGEYLLDYKMVQAKFNVGDWVTINSDLANPNCMIYDKSPKKPSNIT